jgi:hypothetical protein
MQDKQQAKSMSGNGCHPTKLKQCLAGLLLLVALVPVPSAFKPTRPLLPRGKPVVKARPPQPL